jgi:hypothetical protein
VGVIERPATGKQTMAIADCPCCGGEIAVSDCGYSTFNPGTAKCTGDCKRTWGFSQVEDKWDCGLQWNRRATEIRRKLKLLSLLGVKRRGVSISRDYALEDLEAEAELLLKSFEESVIGAASK